jgi:hypothetical protein
MPLLVVVLVFTVEAGFIAAVLVVGLRRLVRLRRELEDMVAYQRERTSKPPWRRPR